MPRYLRTQDYPTQDYPTQDYQTQDYPTQDHETQDHRFSRRFSSPSQPMDLLPPAPGASSRASAAWSELYFGPSPPGASPDRHPGSTGIVLHNLTTADPIPDPSPPPHRAGSFPPGPRVRSTAKSLSWSAAARSRSTGTINFLVDSQPPLSTTTYRMNPVL